MIDIGLTHPSRTLSDTPPVVAGGQGGPETLAPMVGVASASQARKRWRPLADLNGANLAAGLTTGLIYATSGVAVHMAVAAQLHLSAGEAARWFFIICLTGAISSLLLTLRYRQPISITITIPGWLLLAAVGEQYSLAEIAGAGLLAGVVILVLGVLGIGERLLRWLPVPVVMGMLAGSMLDYGISVFSHLGLQPVTVGSALAGYIGARALRRAWLPPVGLALAAGLTAALAMGQVQSPVLQWSAPPLTPLAPAWTVQSVMALALPLVILALGIGHVQGASVLVSQGYRPPLTPITIAVGIATIVNALFGGHPASMARSGLAIVAGEEAGPREQRYVASLVAAVCLLIMGLGATTAGALLGLLPAGLIASVAGLASLTVLLEALRKALVTDRPVGAGVALLIAASPLTLLGFSPACWALVGGLVVSWIVERPAPPVAG